jgi:DNA invertase Pin-like site-specific DNA recombinase
LDLQIDLLIKAGCNRKNIFVDKISGVKSERPSLTNCCLDALKAGDVLMGWRLDRLGRSMPHLVSLIETFKEKSLGFKSLSDGAIDITTPSGELSFNIFSFMA